MHLFSASSARLCPQTYVWGGSGGSGGSFGHGSLLLLQHTKKYEKYRHETPRGCYEAEKKVCNAKILFGNASWAAV